MSLLLATVWSMSLLWHEMGGRSLWMWFDTSLCRGSMLVTFVTVIRCEGTAGGGVNDEGERLSRVLRWCSRSSVHVARFHVQCQGSKGEDSM